MILFEATNGLIGASYVRRYAWARDEAKARELLGPQCGGWKLKPLLHDQSPEFVTAESSDGWDVEES